MRVSYVRKIKDQVPLSQKELLLAKTTIKNAIMHHNKGVIEPLLSRGFGLLTPLSGKKTALSLAIESQSAEIVELLLIESLRTFQLFPAQDISDCFSWIFRKKHYHLVDLLLFAVRQYSETQKKHEKTLLVIDQLEKYISLIKKDELQDYHLKEFEQMIAKMEYKKEIFFYIDYKWNKELGDRYSKSLDFYKTLANHYFQRDVDQRKTQENSVLFQAVIGLFMSLGLGYFLISQSSATLMSAISEYYTLILAWLGCAGFSILSMSWWHKLSRKNFLDLQARKLHKAARDGNYAEIAELIEKGAHPSTLCGMAESTALREAMLFKHQSIINFLQQFQVYSGKGKETLLFP